MKKNSPNTLPPIIIHLFFFIGLFSAIAFRCMVVLQHLSPKWVWPVWYVGIIGYILFFSYRYRISLKRKKAIEQYHLIQKLENNDTLNDEERNACLYLLSSIKKSKESLNYFFIFLFSTIAIAVDIVLTIQEK